MKLEGANVFFDSVDYTIYTMNSATTGQYCIVLPKNIQNSLNMLIDLRMKSLFDSVSNGTKTKEQLVEDIRLEYIKLKEQYSDGMLVLPMIEESAFQNAIMNNDKQKMFDEVKKVSSITSELYKKLLDCGIDKQKIDQKIILVEKNSDDEKFVEWLKTQMPNFVDGVRYQGTVPEAPSMNNPFLGGSVESISAEKEVSIPNSVESDNIFGSSNTSSQANVSSGDLFGNAVSNVENNSSTTQQDFFGTPNTNSTTNIEEPKPVQNVDLNGTMLFNPIPETESPKNAQPELNNQNEETNVDGVSETRSASKGFANLLILLVILVGVTIVSIELGKFLYSVYGK